MDWSQNRRETDEERPMAGYKAPLRDFEFAYYELFDGESLTKIPGYEEAGRDVMLTIAEEFGRVCEEVVEPLNASGDEEGCRLQDGVVKTPHGFADAYALLQKDGWIGLISSPDYGGQGLPHIADLITTEMLCSANLSFALYVTLVRGAYGALLIHADDEIKRTYLPKLGDGTWAGTMCLTEPQSGTDLGLVSCRAEPRGDGSYLLSGNKIFITCGDHDCAENIVHLVLARLEDAPEGIKGISLFVAPKLREEEGRLVPNGITCGALEHKMGINGSATCAMHFDGSVAHLVGEPHQGMRAMFTFMNAARLHVGVQGLAAAEAAYQLAVEFARDRLQGRALTGAKHPDKPADPILVHPDVRRMLLTQKAFLEGGRGLTAWIGMELDHVHRSPDAARRVEADDLCSLLTPVIKAFLTDLGFESANLALQVCGGYGYTRDYRVEQLVRDARITMIYEGTNGIQALDLVGRKLPAHMGRYLRRFFHPLQAFLEEQSARPEMEEFVVPLAKAAERLQRATGWLAQAAMKNPDEAGAASVDYLHLFGWVAMGYVWARAASVSLDKLEGGRDAFYEAKLATARFFMQRMLPRHSAHFAALMAGSESMMAFPDEAL
jgi:butyryl-CoA dehydrogenase